MLNRPFWTSPSSRRPPTVPRPCRAGVSASLYVIVGVIGLQLAIAASLWRRVT